MLHQYEYRLFLIIFSIELSLSSAFKRVFFNEFINKFSQASTPVMFILELPISYYFLRRFADQFWMH